MQRIEWIDKTKGFAMICVVLGHAITGSIRDNNVLLGTLYDFIYLFHMPLFIFLSGYLYQRSENKYLKKKKSQFILSKAKYLMVPYFVYSTITYIGVYIGNLIPIVGDVLSNGGYEVKGIKTSILQIVFWQDSLDQHLWFIYCLFLIYIFNIFFMKGNSKKNKIIYILISLLINIIFLKSNIDLLQRFSNYLFYFVIGRCCYGESWITKEENSHKKLAISLICTLLFTVIRLLTINIIFESYILTILKALFSIITSLSLIYFICLLFQNRVFSHKFRILNWIYKYNFEIYILHQPFIVSGGTMLLITILGESQFIDIGIVLCITIIGILLCIGITKIIHHSHIASKLLFGK